MLTMTLTETKKVFQVLESLYSKVYLLVDWLNSLRTEDGRPPTVFHDDDTKSFRQLLTTSVLTFSQDAKPLEQPISFANASHQRELLLRVIGRIKKQGKTHKNVFTIGFEMMSDDPNAQIASLPTIEYKYPNNNFSRLQLSNWKKLLARVGDQVMEYMLENTSVFLFLGPNCYTQVIGLPAYELPCLVSGQQLSLKPCLPGEGNYAGLDKSSKHRWKESLRRRAPGRKEKWSRDTADRRSMVGRHGRQDRDKRNQIISNIVLPSVQIDHLAGNVTTPDFTPRKRRLSNGNSRDMSRATKKARIGPLEAIPSTSGTSFLIGSPPSGSEQSSDGDVDSRTSASDIDLRNTGPSVYARTTVPRVDNKTATLKRKTVPSVDNRTAAHGASNRTPLPNVDNRTAAYGASKRTTLRSVDNSTTPLAASRKTPFLSVNNSATPLISSRKTHLSSVDNSTTPLGASRKTPLLCVDNSAAILGASNKTTVRSAQPQVSEPSPNTQETVTRNGKRKWKKTRRGGKKERRTLAAETSRAPDESTLSRSYNYHQALPRMTCLYARDLREQLPKNHILSMCKPVKMDIAALFMTMFSGLITKRSPDQQDHRMESTDGDTHQTNPHIDIPTNKNEDKSTENIKDMADVLPYQKSDPCNLKGVDLVEGSIRCEKLGVLRNKRKADQDVGSCENNKRPRQELGESTMDITEESVISQEKEMCAERQWTNTTGACCLDSDATLDSSRVFHEANAKAGVQNPGETTPIQSAPAESQSREIIDTLTDSQKAQSGEVICSKHENKQSPGFPLNSGSESLFSSSEHSSKHHTSELDDSDVSRGDNNFSLNRSRETNPTGIHNPENCELAGRRQKNSSSLDEQSKSSDHKSFFGLDDSREKSEQQDFLDKFGLFFGKGSNMFLRGLPGAIPAPETSTTQPDGKTESQQSEGEQLTTADISEFIHSSSLPSVYRKLEPHLLALLQNHRSFPFRAFLNRYCPMKTSKDRRTSGKNSDGQRKGKTMCAKMRTSTRDDSAPTAVPCLSGPVYHRQNSSQASSTSSQSETRARIRRQQCPNKRKHVAKKSGVRTSILLEDHVTPRQVFLFLRQVCCRILSREIIGSRHNWNTLMRSLKRLLSLGKFDKMCLGTLMEKMKVNSCHWIPETSCHGDRVAIFAQVVWWIFTTFFMVILKSFFYITDTTGYRNKLFYYRKPVWHQLKQHAQAALLKNGFLKSQNLVQVKSKLQAGESLGLAHLRFLPKTKSLRPILNMAKKPPADSVKDIPINKQLADVFQVLTFEKDRDPSLLGSSVFGADHIYMRWKKFVSHRRIKHDDRPLYFVKVDIQNCFDSINQKKLFNIISNILKQSGTEEYIIRKYVKIFTAGGKVKRSFCRHVTELHDFEPDFAKFVKRIAQEGNTRNALVLDQILHQHVSPEEVLEKLHHHLFNNIIKVGTKYYLQTMGISQGSVLSTVLCNLYYGDMEGGVLSPDDDEIVMRMVDDWLYVTPYQHQAVKFLNSMLGGHPEYNCNTNAAKTLINFEHISPEHGVISHINNDQELFPWCGMLFDMATLSLSVDYSRYAGISIADTMTFDLSYQPGNTMKNKLMGALRMRCHGLYLDSQINTLEVVACNTYKMFLLLAYKFHACVRRLPFKHRGNDNPVFFLDMIQDLALYFLHHTTAKIKQLAVEASFLLSKTAVKWLCFQAFSSKLSNHQSEYYILLKAIKMLQKTLLANSNAEDRMDVCTKIQEDRPEEFLSMLD